MQFVVSNCCYFFYLVLDWARKSQSFMAGSVGIALSFIKFITVAALREVIILYSVWIVSIAISHYKCSNALFLKS